MLRDLRAACDLPWSEAGTLFDGVAQVGGVVVAHGGGGLFHRVNAVAQKLDSLLEADVVAVLDGREMGVLLKFIPEGALD